MTDLKTMLYTPGTDDHLLPAIVDLHIRCIEYDGALLRFHPPFTDAKKEKMLEFWKERIEQIVAGRKIMILAFNSGTSESSSSTTEAVAVIHDSIAGIVELGLPEAETGPFRADVEMLMVSPHHRKGGVGRKLMQELESLAFARNRTLLQLGTTAGSVAEQYLYPKLGYVKIGVVPKFGISPTTKELVDGVLFYKDLSDVIP